MPRDLTSRVFRAILAVWFVLSVGEPSVVRICPMHASAAAELADGDAGGMAVAPQTNPEHGAHGHHAPHGASSHSHSSGGHAHHCTCIGCCIGCASSALAATRLQIETPKIVAVVATTVSPSDVLSVQGPPHLLPPGTGPPRA